MIMGCGEKEKHVPLYFCLQNTLLLEETWHGVEEGVQVWGQAVLYGTPT